LFILTEALMTDSSQSVPIHPPSDPTKTVEKDGYRATFYPGFVRTLSVRSATGEVELYDQQETFFLPPGQEKPWPSSTLEFVRPDGRRVRLMVDDAHQQIDRIEVTFKSRAVEGDARVRAYSDDPPADGGDDPITLVLRDGPVLCPPVCPNPS
jgi:hypothetical protein